MDILILHKITFLIFITFALISWIYIGLYMLVYKKLHPTIERNYKFWYKLYSPIDHWFMKYPTILGIFIMFICIFSIIWLILNWSKIFIK